MRTALKVVVFGFGAAMSVLVSRAESFSVQFTDSFSPGGAIIGTGTLSFDGVYGDGTYLISSLTNFDVNFTIGGTTFTTANIDTSNQAYQEVVIYNGGTEFYFDSAGSNYGTTYSGSVDFTGPASYSLTTEPNGFGPTPLDLYHASTADGSYFGTYEEVTPEPTTLVLLGTGLAGMFVRRLRRAGSSPQ